MFGACPMATKRPVTGRVDSSAVATFLMRTPSTDRSPRTSDTWASHMKSMRGLRKARSCMIFEARSSLRRWMTVTLSPNLVRKVASSMAESPPPTTAMCCPLKKKPSQVAQVDTPCPSRRASEGRPSIRDRAPVATITLRAR